MLAAILQPTFIEEQVKKMTIVQTKAAVEKMNDVSNWSIERVAHHIKQELYPEIATMSAQLLVFEQSVKAVHLALKATALAWGQVGKNGPGMLYELVKCRHVELETEAKVMAKMALFTITPF